MGADVTENESKSLRWRRAAVLGLLSALTSYAVFTIVVQNNATSAFPQTISGRFMGFDATGTAMAFQADGSATGTSYAWNPGTLWVSSNNTTHSGGPVTCLQPSDRGHRTTIGVVTVKPRGIYPGTVLIAWVKC